MIYIQSVVFFLNTRTLRLAFSRINIIRIINLKKNKIETKINQFK